MFLFFLLISHPIQLFLSIIVGCAVWGGVYHASCVFAAPCLRSLHQEWKFILDVWENKPKTKNFLTSNAVLAKFYPLLEKGL